jgi:PTS system nitrogen regulatory IIA component
MPHEVMNEQQVAAYLQMDIREVNKLASRGHIPCRKVAGGFQFRKGQVDHWIESQMHGFGRRRLAGIEAGVSAHHGFDADGLVVDPLIPKAGLAVPMQARTREGTLQDLIDLAEGAGLVYNRDDLAQQIRAREELCSTALVPQVAFPHPRNPLPYDIAESFVVVGLAPGGIPFGAEDGTLTRLFFLICCKDDRTHLHVLARLARMLHAQEHIDRLLAADAPNELRHMLRELEHAALSQP